MGDGLVSPWRERDRLYLFAVRSVHDGPASSRSSRRSAAAFGRRAVVQGRGGTSFRGSSDRGRIRFHGGVSFSLETSFNLNDGRKTKESVADGQRRVTPTTAAGLHRESAGLTTWACIGCAPEPHGAAARRACRRLNCSCWSDCWSDGCIQGDGGANFCLSSHPSVKKGSHLGANSNTVGIASVVPPACSCARSRYRAAGARLAGHRRRDPTIPARR